MARAITWDSKDFAKILKNNGYTFVRQKGSHRTYQNKDGNTITVNLKQINKMVAKRIIKENQLIVDLF